MPPSRDPAAGRYFRAVERFPRVRQSTLSTFDSCGLSAKFEAELRRGWSTHPQARGTIFHRTAAECLRTMYAASEPEIPVDVALAHLHDVLRQEDVDRECPKCRGHRIKRGIKDGMRTCGQCGHLFPTELMNVPSSEVKDLRMATIKWAHDNAWDIGNLVDVEQRLDAKVRYPNPAGGTVERVVTGQMDAIFMDPADVDHFIVLDWKDTWALPAPTAISFEGYFQQRMYGWLIMRNYPSVQRVTLREFYVRFSEPREVTLWRDALDDVEQEFSALVQRFDRAIHEGTFTPTPGHHCQWCLRPGACPILPEVRQEGRIRTTAEAQKVTHVQVVAKAYYDQTTKALQAWANTHGPIEIKDAKGRRVLGYRETETVRRPTREALEQAVREAGDRGLNRKQLDALFPKHKATRFEQHVPPRVVETDDGAALQASLEGALAAARASHATSDVA